MTSSALLMLLASTSPSKAGEPCSYNTNGSVTCEGPAFKKLTDHIIELRGKNMLLTNDVLLAKENGEQFKKEMLRCEAALKAIPTPKQPDPSMPVMGYAMGIIGTVLAGSALVLDAPAEVRASLVVGGVVSVASGLTLVLP